MTLFFRRLAPWLASPAILFYTLPWLMALVAAATVTQPALGLHKAVRLFIDSWIVWADMLPLPGGLAALALLGVNLLARFLFKSEWRWRKSGIHLAHLGVLVLLAGGLVTRSATLEGYMVIPEGKTSDVVYAYDEGEIRIVPPAKPGESMQWGTELARLPFALTLEDFVRDTYPGTDTPRAYHSDVELLQNGQAAKTRISLNEPLRLRGYALYQSSFLDVGDRQATVLQVTRDQGRLLPYLAFALLAFGLSLHLFLMRKAKS